MFGSKAQQKRGELAIQGVEHVRRQELVDRVGGGDSFASGLQFGFMQFNDAQKAVEYGAAHGALASTTPGDTSMATRKEVEKQISGGGARVVR